MARSAFGRPVQEKQLKVGSREMELLFTRNVLNRTPPLQKRVMYPKKAWHINKNNNDPIVKETENIT